MLDDAVQHVRSDGACHINDVGVGNLQRQGLPDVGTRVTVTLPGGARATGTVSDGFTESNAEFGFEEDGIKIDLDNSASFEEFASSLDDYNIIITPVEGDKTFDPKRDSKVLVSATILPASSTTARWVVQPWPAWSPSWPRLSMRWLMAGTTAAA